MRRAIYRVDNVCWNGDKRNAPPVKAHRYLDVEIHAQAQFLAVEQSYGRFQRVHAKAAHGIGNIQRQRFDPHPKACNPSSVQAARRHRVIELWFPGD